MTQDAERPMRAKDGNVPASLRTDALFEVRYALRVLWKRPVFALSAMLTLALGFGAATAVFSVVDPIVFRPLAFTEPERLVALRPNGSFANREIDVLRRDASSFQHVAALSPGWLMAHTAVASPEQLNAARVSGNLFDMLGVRAAIGTAFGAESEVPGQDAVAVLSHELWVRRFGADPSVIGRAVRLDGRDYVVQGVMPAGFQLLSFRTDLWVPLTFDAQAMTWAGATAFGLARLRTGVTIESATQEMQLIAARMRDAFELPPDYAQGRMVARLADTVIGDVRPMLLILLGAVGFVLCIAAANVANLLLVRTAERQRELAVRYALGASRGRVVRMVLTESLTLGAIGGLAGAGLATLAVRALAARLPRNIPRLAEIGVDVRVLAIGAALTLLVSLAFGAAPAFFAARNALSGRLRAGRTVAEGHTRGTLIAAQVAVAVVLAVGASLMARTLLALQRVDPGFSAENRLTLQLQPSGRSAEEGRAYWARVLETVRGTPGVLAAGTILHVPMSGRTWNADIEVEGRPLMDQQARPRSAWQAVSEGYLETVQIPLRSGRDFTADDHAGGPRVLLINDAFARAIFPGEDPIGRRIRAGNATQNEWATIVGVIGSVRHQSLSRDASPELYVSFNQRRVVANALVVRAQADPLALVASLSERIWDIDPNVPISQVRTMTDWLSASVARERAVLALLASFALIGLTLGAIGIYGVVAWSARQRAREIGIRLALGASPPSLVRFVARQGLIASLAGVAAGLLLAALLVRFMRGLVFGVATLDPITFLLVPAALLIVAAVAGTLPAARAARVPPAAVLND